MTKRCMDKRKATVYLTPSARPDKKYTAVVLFRDGRRRTVHFGGRREDGTPYEDFTTHKDPERRARYDVRHSSKEDWTATGMDKAGFWSRWLLWSRPSLKEAIRYTERKFHIRILRGPPP
jgi:hypothetical protein